MSLCSSKPSNGSLSNSEYNPRPSQELGRPQATWSPVIPCPHSISVRCNPLPSSQDNTHPPISLGPQHMLFLLARYRFSGCAQAFLLIRSRSLLTYRLSKEAFPDPSKRVIALPCPLPSFTLPICHALARTSQEAPPSDMHLPRSACRRACPAHCCLGA